MAGSRPRARDAVGRRHLAVLLAAIALLAACGEDPAPTDGPTTPDAGTARAPVDLAGAWRLVDGADAAGALTVPPGHEVTLVVDGQEVTGVSACNHYMATLTVDGAAVSFEGVGTTMMACAPDVMAVEERYAAALRQVTAATRTGPSLELTGTDVRLSYELDPPVADTDLVGTTWRLESLVDGETVASAEPGGLLLLSADGTWRASTGCGDLRGGYRLRDGRVTVHDVRSRPAADGACGEPALAQHEHVSGVLVGGFETVVDGTVLRVTGGDGRGLDYRAG